MKIFSLETKKYVLGWSVVLGALTNWAIMILTTRSSNGLSLDSHSVACSDCYQAHMGWPFALKYAALIRYDYENRLAGAGNFIFWIFIVFIILSLVRHFRNKKA